jgi:Tfp pilus tip-associated adhesin PilY1
MSCLAVILLLATTANAAPQDAYCIVPPYITKSSSKPNINLVLDYTGSMQGPAYLASCTFGYVDQSTASNHTSTCTNYDTSSDPVMPTAYRYKVAKDYWGYFKMDSYYKYDTTAGAWVENAACNYATTDVNYKKGKFADGSGGCISGNLLNWAIMTRTDVLRKVLTGGRIKAATTDVFESEGMKYYIMDPDLKCNFAITYATTGDPKSRKIAISNNSAGTCVLGTLATASNIDVKTSTPADDKKGLIDSFFPSVADMEVSIYSTEKTPKVVYRVGKNNETNNNTTALETAALDAMKNAVNNEEPWGSTNTGPAIRESQHFFKQDTMQYAANQARVSIGNYLKDPYYEFGNLRATCKKAFTIVISDGEYNDGEDPVKPAYDMRMNDLRTEAGMTGTQRGNTYTIYAFGTTATGRQSLITTAMYGGFDDGDGNNWPYPFTALPSDSLNVTYPRTECNVVTADSTSTLTVSTGSKSLTLVPGTGTASIVAGKAITIAFYDPDTVGLDYSTSLLGTVTSYNNTTGALVVNVTKVTGTGTAALWRTFTSIRWDASCAEWDKNKVGLPYNFFEASDGSTLKRELTKAITDILGRVASGTASSILSNSEGSGANLLQAVFYPNKMFSDGVQVDWIGEMQNLWYYIDPFTNKSSLREDTDGDNVLDLKKDNTANFYFKDPDTLVKVEQDTNGDGLGDTLVNAVAKPDDINSIWRAGRQLRSKTAASRTIHTSVTGVSLLAEEVLGKGGLYWETGKEVNATTLIPYLQADLGLADSEKIISYLRGDDQLNYRARQVPLTTGDTMLEWKLGDIISSTPKLQSSNQLNNFSLGYGDKSYTKFTSTSNYKNRGMVYVGANDGMMHAFKLGKLTVSGPSIIGDVKAILSGTDLGEEQWAYIPRNTLPYLKYLAVKTGFKHLYYVDGPTTISDVSIGIPSTCGSGIDYSLCSKDLTDGTNWRTLLIGSMGLGGASKLKDVGTCTDGVSGTCVKTPIFDPLDTATTKTKGIGYSSYFALDITDQYFDTTTGALAHQPTLKWEFAPPGLGYATSGAAIVRVGIPGDSNADGGSKKNGKWFAVMASGPTGPIDGAGQQFLGRSDQNLKIFVVDLGATVDATHPLKGCDIDGTVSASTIQSCAADTNYWVIDSGLLRSFGGSILPGMIDTDKWNKSLAGNYSDDAIYVGYTQASNIVSATIDTATTTWTNGGVIRILTKEDINPANWRVSKVISGIGPVNSGIMKMQDRTKHKLWLYFGTGRFFYGADDVSSIRYLMGVQDRCYGANDKIDPNCQTTIGLGDLVDQSSTVTSLSGTIVTPLDQKGWYIKLPGEDTANTKSSHRAITDAVAVSSGMVLYTSFAPISDICKFGGESRMWSLRYDTGGLPLCASLKGKAMIQMSTGSFEQQNLADIFSCDTGTPSGPGVTRLPLITPTSAPPNNPDGGTYPAPPSPPMQGKPPVEAPTYINPGANLPIKKLIHTQEK